MAIVAKEAFTSVYFVYIPKACTKRARKMRVNNRLSVEIHRQVKHDNDKPPVIFFLSTSLN